MDKRPAQAIRKVVKVIAVAVVGLALVLALSLFLLQQSSRLHNRTVHERQFKIGAEDWQLDLRTVRQFELRHGLSPEIRNGFRFAMDEWPSWKYLISIDVLPNGSGRGAILAEPYDGKGEKYERSFELKDGEARIFQANFDRKIEGFWGSTVECADGTGFQFERWGTKGLSSGFGNAACRCITPI